MAAAADESASRTRSRSRLKRSPRPAETAELRTFLSPTFRSAAALAGWDEEALLHASLVVEDTPERESQHKKRLNQNNKTPITSSSGSTGRKRRSRLLADPIPAVVLCLDDDEQISSRQEVEALKKEPEGCTLSEKKKGNIGAEVSAEIVGGKGLPCLDRLREELSCAICWEICYEPSTTPCGHSFCKKCLESAANKCGKTCPKCRQLISNARLGAVNTVLWNTIQLLFPEEMEVRKKATTHLNTFSTKDASRCDSKLDRVLRNRRSRNFHNSINNSSSSDGFRTASDVLEVSSGIRQSRRRLNASQFEDAALALRLQREEFLEAFRTSRRQRRN